MTPLPLATWDLTTTPVPLGGIEVQGFGDGDCITITPPDATYKSMVGGDGSTVISVDPSRVHVAKLVLQRTSSVNFLLGGLFADQRANARNGVALAVPFTCRDNVSEEVFRAAEAWITRSPERKWTKEAPTVEWTVEFLADESPDA